MLYAVSVLYLDRRRVRESEGERGIGRAEAEGGVALNIIIFLKIYS